MPTPPGAVVTSNPNVPIVPPPEPNPAAPTPTVTAPVNPFAPKPPLTDAQHLQNFMHLWKINSAAAYDYLSQGGRGAQSWGQRNQKWMTDNLFNGDQYAMNQWKNDSDTHKNNMYAQADPGFQQYVNDLSNGSKTPSGTPWDPSQGVTPWMSGAQFNPFATAAGGGGGGYAPGGSPGTQPTPFNPSFGYNPFDPGYHGTNNYDPTTGTYGNEEWRPGSGAGAGPGPNPDAPAVSVPEPEGRINREPDAATLPTVTNNAATSTVNPYVTIPNKSYRYRNPFITVQ